MKKLLFLLCTVFTIIGCSHQKNTLVKPVAKSSNNPLLYIDSPFAFVLPNAFTPNGDGKNDLYRPVSAGLTNNNFRLTITRQNGDTVFQSVDYHTAWQGIDMQGHPDTTYRHNVFVTFTNAHGSTIDTSTILYLLTPSPQGCIRAIQPDLQTYIFEDQLDPTNFRSVYPTSESFCP